MNLFCHKNKIWIHDCAVRLHERTVLHALNLPLFSPFLPFPPSLLPSSLLFSLSLCHGLRNDCPNSFKNAHFSLHIARYYCCPNRCKYFLSFTAFDPTMKIARPSSPPSRSRANRMLLSQTPPQKSGVPLLTALSYTKGCELIS